MRKVLMTAGVVLLILVVAVVALGFFVDADRFRPQVEEQASQALGRQVTIGKLKLALFSGGVAAENLAVADDSHFSSDPFLTAGSVGIGVDLGALIFHRELSVRSFTVHAPHLILVQNAKGDWNYSTLGKSSEAKTKAATSSAKQAKATPASAKQTNDAGAAAAITVGKFTIDDGKVTVRHLGTRRSSEYTKLHLVATDIRPNAAIPYQMSAVAPGGGTVEARGRFGPLAEQSERTPLTAFVSVKNLDIAATGFSDPSSPLKGLVDVDAKVMSNGTRSDVIAQIVGHKMCLAAGCSPATTPIKLDVKAGYLLADKLAQLTSAQLRLGSSAANLTGTVNLKGTQPLVNARVDANGMSMNDVLGILPAVGVVLPPGARLEGGTASVHATAIGPADALTIKGHVLVSNTKLTGYDLGSQMAMVTKLAGVNVGKETLIQELSSDITQNTAGIQATNMVLNMPGLARVTGAGTVDSKNNLNFAMKAVVDMSKGAVGKISSVLGSKNTNVPVPFHIKGTTSNPKFIPDVTMPVAALPGAAGALGNAAGALGGKTGSKTEEGVTKGLGGLLNKF
jgi:AsmA protein